MSAPEPILDDIKRADRMKDLRKNITIVEKEIKDNDKQFSSSITRDQVHKLATLINVTEDEWMEQRLYWIDFIRNEYFLDHLDKSPDKSKTKLFRESRLTIHPFNLSANPEVFEEEIWRKCYSHVSWTSSIWKDKYRCIVG
jgi:hypothetical protein